MHAFKESSSKTRCADCSNHRLSQSGDYTNLRRLFAKNPVMAMSRQQPLNSDSASIERMEVAHEDDDVPIIGWAM